MAEDTPTTNDDSVSRKAHDRVVTERDQLKAEKAELEKAVRGFHRRDKLAETFTEVEGVQNPWQTANVAMRDIRFQDADDDDLSTVASSWLEEIRGLTGSPAPKAEEPEGDEGPPAQPAQPAPWVAPNPAAGSAAGPKQVIMGTTEYQQWRQGKDMSQIQQAIKRGEVVVPSNIQQLGSVGGS